MSRGFWAAFWAVLLAVVALPLAITSYLAWYSAVRDQCEKSGGTLYMPNPLTLACVKPERIPLT